MADARSKPARAKPACEDAPGRLTQRVVNEAEATGVKQRLADHEVKGLFLRVTPAGAKSYVLRYSQDGRRGEAAIGDARSITLVAARAKGIDIWQ
jgi:hypothetical protein